MDIIIHNKNIVIKGADDNFKDYLRTHLSYTDKSKEYMLRRMEKNPFQRNSPAYFAAKKEMSGCLLVEDGDELIVPSGFADLFNDMNPTDKRCDTGKKIALPWKNKPFDCRDYQAEAVSLLENNRRGLINFATGLGKTLTAVHAIRKIKKRTLVLCPGKSIADQFYSDLCEAFGNEKIGYLGGGKKKLGDITVGIVGTVVNNIDKLKEHNLGLIIVDECHHIPASTFFTIADELGDVGRMFGLTATDFRSDGKDVMITAGVGQVLIKRDLIWGIKSGWLADPYIIVRDVRTHGREFRNDKLKNYKEHVLNSSEMNERLLKDMKGFLAAGKSVLCLVSEVAHGQMLADELGLPFATGSDKKSKDYVDQLNAGEIPGLIGTSSKIGEGTDTKRVDVLMLANFVASKGPLWQNLGRGMRLYGDKKNVIVLDYIPTGSSMLTRHAKKRIQFYKEITKNIKII